MTDFIEIEPHNGHDTIGNDGTGNGIIVVKGLKDDFEVVSGGNVKVMLWENLDTIRPICNFIEKPVN